MARESLMLLSTNTQDSKKTWKELQNTQHVLTDMQTKLLNRVQAKTRGQMLPPPPERNPGTYV